MAFKRKKKKEEELKAEKKGAPDVEPFINPDTANKGSPTPSAPKPTTTTTVDGVERLDVLDLKEHERRKRALLERERANKKKLQYCQAALKSVTSMGVTWFFVILIVSGVFFASWNVGFFQFNEKFGSGFTFSIVCAILILAFSRLITAISISKKFSHDKKFFNKAMPTEVNPTIREFYIIQHCRRCAHYWITFAICGLCVVFIIYTLIRVGIDKLANGGTYTLMLFKKDAYNSLSITDPTSIFRSFFKDWSQRVFFGSIFTILFMYVLYTVVDKKNKKVITYLEDIYGREKLVNDCLLSFRVNEVNKRYKSVAFAVVCFVGCLIYLFFKKMIVTVFDKSFSV